jgi:hypothetical protein
MKTLFVVLGLMLSQLGFSQGLIFTGVEKAPEFLRLEKVTGFVDQELMHVDYNNGLSHSKIVFNENLGGSDLKKKLLKIDFTKLYCDGKFEIRKDEHNSPYIYIASINVCINYAGKKVINNRRLNTDAIANKLFSEAINDANRNPRSPAVIDERGGYEPFQSEEEVEATTSFRRKKSINGNQ